MSQQAQPKRSGFEDIEIGWKGETFTVPATRALGLLAAIEEVLAPGGQGSAIEVLSQPHKHHLTRLARAYGVALRYAGAVVSDETVYLSLAKGVQKGGVEGYQAMATLADGLLQMFFPEWALDPVGNEQGQPEPEEPEAPMQKSSDAA